MADEIVRLRVDDNQFQSGLLVLKDLLRKKGAPDAFIDETLQALAEYAGVIAEQNQIIYPPQREPLPEKPRFSKKTGKQLKPRKRKRYKRTGVLGGSLTSDARRESALAWVAYVGTNVSYAPYVVGMPDDDPGQAWFHQNYWSPLELQLKDELPVIIYGVNLRLYQIVQALMKG